MTTLLERDPKEKEIEERHQRYRDLVETDRYQERANRTFGTNPYYKKETRQPVAQPEDKNVLFPGNPNYTANRVKNASSIAKGEYAQPDYRQAPAWDFMANIPAEEPEMVSYVETDDEKPTLTTTQYASAIKQQSTEAVADEYFSLSASAKIVIAVLATVVLAIIALIWVNASVISTLSSETAVIEQQISMLATQLSGINEEIASATSEEALQAFVNAAGMILG